MCRNEKGFTTPALLLVALALLLVPAYYWAKTNSVTLSSDTQSVMGIKSNSENSEKPGFRVSIMSSAQKWDLVQYLCVSKAECLEKLESGQRAGTVSGGRTNLHQVVVNYSNGWEAFEYMKYYVRSGWGSGATIYDVVDSGSVPGSSVEIVEDGGLNYEVVLIPLDSVRSSFYESATFSDL